MEKGRRIRAARTWCSSHHQGKKERALRFSGGCTHSRGTEYVKQEKGGEREGSLKDCFRLGDEREMGSADAGAPHRIWYQAQSRKKKKEEGSEGGSGRVLYKSVLRPSPSPSSLSTLSVRVVRSSPCPRTGGKKKGEGGRRRRKPDTNPPSTWRENSFCRQKSEHQVLSGIYMDQRSKAVCVRKEGDGSIGRAKSTSANTVPKDRSRLPRQEEKAESNYAVTEK